MIIDFIIPHFIIPHFFTQIMTYKINLTNRFKIKSVMYLRIMIIQIFSI